VDKVFTSKRRTWVYNVAIAAGPLVVFYGLLSAEEIALWGGLLAVLLGTGPAALARANVSEDGL
jgi:hypothetical protein